MSQETLNLRLHSFRRTTSGRWKRDALAPGKHPSVFIEAHSLGLIRVYRGF